MPQEVDAQRPAGSSDISAAVDRRDDAWGADGMMDCSADASLHK